jgi:peptidoglycan/xylan/chitin deacetylase (PgdA/CDA1 family)
VTIPDSPRPSGQAANLKVLDWAGFRSAVTYTFDDSQPSQVVHYPELAATGVPMTFFITTSASYFAGYDATWARAVRDGHEMGNHSVHHCHAGLHGCTGGDALPSVDAEIDQCTSYIVQRLGQGAVWTAASPFGDTGYAAPARARFFLNRGVRPGTVAPNAGIDPFDLPCHMAEAGEPRHRFDTATDEARASGAWIIFLFHTVTPTPDNWYAPVDVAAITGTIEHAKSLPDVWIDTMANVGAYWLGQRILSAAAPATSGASTTWTWRLPPHFPPGRHVRVKVDGGTLAQGGAALPWVRQGYYEVALDAGSLTWSPSP